LFGRPSELLEYALNIFRQLLFQQPVWFRQVKKSCWLADQEMGLDFQTAFEPDSPQGMAVESLDGMHLEADLGEPLPQLAMIKHACGSPVSAKPSKEFPDGSVVHIVNESNSFRANQPSKGKLKYWNSSRVRWKISISDIPARSHIKFMCGKSCAMNRTSSSGSYSTRQLA